MLDLIRRPSTNLGLSTFEEMDKLMDNLWRSFNLPTSAFRLPSVDIYSEDDKHMIVELPAPGFSENDIDINVRDNVLEIRGEHTEKAEEKADNRNYLVRESAASFARRVVLPEGANADDIIAELDKGLLRIRVPVERPEAKRIKVQASNGGAKKLNANS